MAPSRGEVWWTELPQLGRRPALVLTRQEAVSAIPRLLAVPATTTVRRLPSEVALDADDGMPRPCVVNLDTPELIPRGLFVEHITTLGPVRMQQVCVALRRATGCP